MRPRAVLLPVVCAALVAVGGCSASSTGGGPTTSAAGSSAPRTSTSASPSASPSPSGFTSTCDDALSLTAVSEAAGQPIVGTTSFVVGEPDTSIGRVSYLNCRYGLPEAAAATPAAAAPTPAATPGADVPAVEIGVSLYATAAQAKTRVAGTVEDYRSTGATPTAVTVGAASGTLLTTPGQPRTLVLASDRRTVAVSMTDAVFTGNDQIVAVAKLALDAVK